MLRILRSMNTLTLHRSTILDAPADAVWQAVTTPRAFVTVTRGLLRFPVVEGRSDHWQEGEEVVGWTVLAAALVEAAAEGRAYPIDVSCSSCAAERRGNLALPGLDVVLDQVLQDRIRPDLLVKVDEAPRFALEVVVSHAPDEPAMQVYRDSDLPVAAVYPSWDLLPQLRRGLTTELCEGGAYGILSRCRFPRHVEDTAPSCRTCDARAIPMTAEVSMIRCYRCTADVRVLDLYDRSVPEGRLVAASCPDLPHLDELADRAGVRLKILTSNTAGGAYLMHVCNACGAKQGDNFLYGVQDDATPNIEAGVWPLVACRAGHLEVKDVRAWPNGSVPRRGRRPALGLVGERPGVFDRAPLVRVREASPREVSPMISRMMGPY
jgi:hypothetical protein